MEKEEVCQNIRIGFRHISLPFYWDTANIELTGANCKFILV